MTDRYNAFTVVLENNIRSDDAQSLIEAIKHFRGVLAIQPHVADLDSYVAESRAKSELTQKLFDVLARDKKER